MLYTKCILSHPLDEDGTRISVMSRHTLNDGVTPDLRISTGCYHEWLRELAPPARLIGDYYKRGLGWEEFEFQYKEYLRQSGVAVMVRELAQRAVSSDITLLCIEETAERCHRGILAQECLCRSPGLIVDHR